MEPYSKKKIYRIILQGGEFDTAEFDITEPLDEFYMAPTKPLRSGSTHTHTPILVKNDRLVYKYAGTTRFGVRIYKFQKQKGKKS